MTAANLVEPSAAKRYSAVPVAFIDDRTLLVAMADPANILAIDDLDDDHRPRRRSRGREPTRTSRP